MAFATNITIIFLHCSCYIINNRVCTLKYLPEAVDYFLPANEACVYNRHKPNVYLDILLIMDYLQ